MFPLEHFGLVEAAKSETYLVAGEAENDKAFLLVLVVQALETLVLGRETAAQHGETGMQSKTERYVPFRRDVHNEDDLALELLEIIGLAVGQLGFELVKLGHGNGGGGECDGARRVC